MTSKQLSQRDIDALLSGAAGDDQPERPINKNAKPYDFRNPDKFSKDHLRGLQIIFETFARLTTSNLSSLLRGQVQVRLSSIDQLAYEEYTAQLPSTTAVSLLSCDPLPDQTLLEISPQVTYVMIDRLLGGSGRVPQRLREATDIEQALLRLVVTHILPSYREAWSTVVAVEPRLEELVFNTALIPSAIPGTVAALALLEINVLGTTGTLSVAIPYTVLEPVMGRLNVQKWLAGTGRGSHSQTGIGFPDRQLQRAMVPVTVVLGTAALDLKELLVLEKGNIIRLETAPGQELRVAIGAHEKFTAQPGQVSNRIAVQITQPLAENAL